MCTESNNLLRIAVHGVRSRAMHVMFIQSQKKHGHSLFYIAKRAIKGRDLQPNIELIRFK